MYVCVPVVLLGSEMQGGHNVGVGTGRRELVQIAGTMAPCKLLCHMVR